MDEMRSSKSKRAMKSTYTAMTFVLILCCTHRDPSRVQIANHSIISFLVDYTSAQTLQLDQTGQYRTEWALDEATNLDPQLATTYNKLRRLHYSCSGSVSRKLFSAICLPDPGSGLTLTFFIDQSLILRMSGEGLANSDSPVVRLTDQERVLLKHKVDK